MSLQCVVLAGGLGTRMRPLTAAVPKALIPVLGRPFVDWQLSLLARQGVDRVVYCIGYRGEMLRSHIGDGCRFGLAVAYSDEGRDLLGTAGAIRRALDEGLLEDSFFVLYGDSYLPIELGHVEQAWRLSGAAALMTVMRNEGRWDRSNCIYENGRVVLYDKSRPLPWRADMRWIDYGVTVLRRSVLAERVGRGAAADLSDLQRELSSSGLLAGLEVRRRFYEAGSPAGLRDLEAYLRGTPDGVG